MVAIALAALPAFWWIRPPTASGTDVGDMIKALAKVQSIRIVTTDRDTGPVQEFLIARRSNTLVINDEAGMRRVRPRTPPHENDRAGR